MRNKKGVELSMNVIIIAAIALLVLVILAVLVLRGGRNITDGTGCTAKPGGHCETLDTACNDGENVFAGGGCPVAKPKCCVKIEGVG
jgi:hypothetical protein